MLSAGGEPEEGGQSGLLKRCHLGSLAGRLRKAEPAGSRRLGARIMKASNAKARGSPESSRASEQPVR